MQSKCSSPNQGTSLNPISWPFTATLACLETKGSCISLEMYLVRFRYGIGHTRIYTIPDATLEQLDDHSDRIDIEFLSESI